MGEACGKYFGKCNQGLFCVKKSGQLEQGVCGKCICFAEVLLNSFIIIVFVVVQCLLCILLLLWMLNYNGNMFFW